MLPNDLFGFGKGRVLGKDIVYNNVILEKIFTHTGRGILLNSKHCVSLTCLVVFRNR